MLQEALWSGRVNEVEIHSCGTKSKRMAFIEALKLICLYTFLSYLLRRHYLDSLNYLYKIVCCGRLPKQHHNNLSSTQILYNHQPP